MSQPDTTSAELGKRKRAPPPSPFSAWKPGDAAKKEAEGQGGKEEGSCQDCKA